MSKEVFCSLLQAVFVHFIREVFNLSSFHFLEIAAIHSLLNNIEQFHFTVLLAFDESS
ncbi:hypothetical protein KFK09_012018 [Dendrobium nobile]|uniref:Uncharacterized protein n=1 Tax=Dendrobium nobile TaxID=94219 RepID=A0A8T3BJR2_DENNO|nr:hypothetical protein KFK09_012018 [Dendrobium nobile]